MTLEAPPSRWQVKFCSLLSQRLLSADSDSGFLYLRPQALRLALLDADGQLLDARYLTMGEVITAGSVISLPCHRVLVGAEFPVETPQARVPPMPSSLDLKPGIGLQKQIWQRFRCPVAFSRAHNNHEFFLVASFGRSKHRLDPSMVAMLLQVSLGGIPQDFNVVFLRDRTYRFSVCNKEVGFFIKNLRHYKCSEFEVFFLLWGNGGPNFSREFYLWEQEEDQSWISVGRKTFADAVRQPLTGANKIPLGRRMRANPAIPAKQRINQLPFIQNFTSWEKQRLSEAILAGLDFDQILRCLRFDDGDRLVISPLDSLQPSQQRDLRNLISSKPSEEIIGHLFWGYSLPQSGLEASTSTVPMHSVFDRLQAAIPPSGAENIIQTDSQTPSLDPGQAHYAATRTRPAQTRVSAFDRLRFPAAPERISAFDRLVFSAQQSGPSAPRPKPTCPRCLQVGHIRRNCWNQIICHACNKPGHIKENCFGAVKQIWVQKEVNLPFKEGLVAVTLDLNLPPNEDHSQPSIADLGLTLAVGSRPSGSIPTCPEQIKGISPISFLGLGLASSSPWYPATQQHCSSSPNTPPAAAALSQSAMANFPVDPTPFIPGQYEIVEVANRPQLCRYHLAGPVTAKHEDVAIATIVPDFPAHQPFAATRLFLRSLIEDELRFSLDISQRCPIGSAYVRVSSPSDRD
ncbi:hypothetical protein ACQ4PT_001745 [Festuca glaucescens]